MQLGIAVVLSLSAAGWAVAQTARPSTTRGAVATVGGQRIEREEFEPLAQRALTEHERQRGTVSGNVRLLLRRQVLEQMIRARLVMLEATRRKTPVSAAEIDAEFRNHPFFQTNGRFDAGRLEKVKAANSPEYQAAVAQIRMELGGRKLDRQIRAEATPEDADLRERASRRHTRARLETWVLRSSDFNGRTREPRELEVVDYYRSHARDFSRLERAQISVIEIGDPAATTGPEATRARARQRADSLIAALRDGGRFDDAGAAFGGMQRRVHVAPNNFPGFWQGDETIRRMVFRSAPGAVLEQPVPSRDGWMVVRVDTVQAAGVAPLREVSREIRSLLRERDRLAGHDGELRKRYEQRRSLLREPAYRVRYAVFQAEGAGVGNPSAAELERYYRGHLADFSEFDAAAGAIRTRPLAEVRDEVAKRWREERRLIATRLDAERLEASWRGGRRDRALEARATLLREVGPVRAGAPIDTGAAGQVVGDSLAGRRGALGVGLAPWGTGSIVFHVHERIADWTPGYEELRRTLLAELEAEERQQEEDEARARFDRDPSRYAQGDVIHFTEYIVPQLEPLKVPLTRREVEQFHQQNLDDYSAPEEIRVRHILISPEGEGPNADAAARREAEGLLARVRAGEDFQQLARQHSDDPPTRDKGGDVGFFGRGIMLDAFERAAFALRPGEISDLVKTEAGYHIIQLADRIPLSAEPLVHMYSNVASDAATAKAERMARHRADSLMRTVRTPAQAKAAAKKLDLEVWGRIFRRGELETMGPVARRFLGKVADLKPGEILNETRYLKGHGIGIAVLDSIVPDRLPEWQHVRSRVIDEQRLFGVRRAMDAKIAELDSMARAGWSVDSLAALWGGFERSDDVAPGKGVPTLGGIAVIDSLVFGVGSKPVLDEGEISDWVWLDRGVARVRLGERRAPTADLLAARMDRTRRYEQERSLQQFFERAKGSFPVRILDPELAEVRIPPIPNPDN